MIAPNENNLLDLSSQIRKEAVAIDRLEGGALAAFFGVGITIGIVFGGAWWVLAAASGCVGLYRGIITYLNYRNKLSLNKQQERKRAIELLEYIEDARLPDKYKDRLSEKIIGNLGIPPVAKKNSILLEKKPNKSVKPDC